MSFGDGDRREIVLKYGEDLLARMERLPGPTAVQVQAYALLCIGDALVNIGDQIRDLRHSIERERPR